MTEQNKTVMLGIYITPELRMKIRIAAAKRDTSMSSFMVKIAENYLSLMDEV